MSENTTTETTDQTPQDAPEAPQEPTAPPEAPEAPETPPEDAQEPEEDQGEEEAGGNREAAKYRRRLREAEAERDALAERVETLQRAEVDRIAVDRGRLRNPEIVWKAGTELSELLADDGNVDVDKVLAAAEQIARDYGIMRSPLVVPSEGRTTGPPRLRDDMAAVISGRADD